MRIKKISKVGKRLKGEKKRHDFYLQTDDKFPSPKLEQSKKRGRPRKPEGRVLQEGQEPEKKIVAPEDDFSSIGDAEEIENFENSEVSE